MISWEDGVEEGPDGVCREIPQRSVYKSTLWITQDGVARRKHYDCQVKEWSWADDVVSYTTDENGRLGIWLENNFVSIENAMVRAWVRRIPESKCRVFLEDYNQEPCLSNICVKDAELENPELPQGKEIWKKLRWKCGAVPCDKSYLISNFGRLKSPYTGNITSGSWWDGRRWGAVANCGLVDLTTASGLIPKEERLEPAIRLAKNALLAGGYTPVELAGDQFYSESSAWTNTTKAAQTMTSQELHSFVPQLVASQLITVLRNIDHSGSLNELAERITPMLSEEITADEFLMNKLRLGRIYVDAV